MCVPYYLASYMTRSNRRSSAQEHGKNIVILQFLCDHSFDVLLSNKHHRQINRILLQRKDLISQLEVVSSIIHFLTYFSDSIYAKKTSLKMTWMMTFVIWWCLINRTDSTFAIFHSIFLSHKRTFAIFHLLGTSTPSNATIIYRDNNDKLQGEW